MTDLRTDARAVDHTPIAYNALEPGATVLSADGERVGTVHRVLADERTGIFDGLVIDIRSGPGGLRFVDAPEVDTIHADHVHISYNAADVPGLPEPSANPAVLEHHGVEDVQGKFRSRLGAPGTGSRASTETERPLRPLRRHLGTPIEDATWPRIIRT